MNKRTTLSRMGIFAAFEDVDNSQGLSAEGQADSIAELLVGGGSGDSSEEKVAKPATGKLDEEDTEADSEEEETPPEESNEDESDESDEEEDDDSWESILGVDEGQLSFDEQGNLKGINTKVNGESATVGMKDLVMGYQNNQANTQKSQLLAEERKQFQEQAGAVAQDYKDKLESVGAMSNFLAEKLVGEFNNIDWDRLRVENPAEYAAAKQDYAARAIEVQEAQRAIVAEKQNLSSTATQQNTQQRQQHLTQQRNRMIENNPAWTNPETFNSDMTALKTFLSSQYGFSDRDFAQADDARLIEVLKDAKSFREGVKFASKKIQKPVPKFQKSQGKSRKRPSKLDNLTKAAKSATGSNKRVAQSDAIAQLLMGG